MNFGELIAKGGALFARKGADALADTLETAPPADLARIQASVSGAPSSSGLTVTVQSFRVGAWSFAGGTIQLPGAGTWYVGVEMWSGQLRTLPRLGHRGWIPVARVVTSATAVTSLQQIAPAMPATRIPRTMAKVLAGKPLSVVVMGSSLTVSGGAATDWPGMVFGGGSVDKYKLPTTINTKYTGVGGSPNQYQLAQLGYASRHSGYGYANAGVPGAIDISGVPNGRSNAFTGVDLVVIGCLANGGDYRLETIEPLARKLKALGVEVIMVTDNPQGPSTDYNAMSSAGLYTDGPEVMRIADLYGHEIADTAAYVFDGHIRAGGTGIYSDTIHMASGAPAGVSGVAANGHELWARAVRSIFTAGVTASSATTYTDTHNFDSGLQGWTALAAAGTVANAAGTAAVTKNTATATQWGIKLPLTATSVGTTLAAGDSVRIQGTMALAGGATGAQIGLVNGSWSSNVVFSAGPAFDVTATATGASSEILLLCSPDAAGIGASVSIDNVTITVTKGASTVPYDAVPGRASDASPMPPIRIVTDYKTPADAFVILPKDEYALFTNNANKGTLAAHPWGAASFARRWSSVVGAAKDMLVLATGKVAYMAAEAGVAVGIIHYREPADGACTVDIKVNGTVQKSMAVSAAPFANEWFFPIYTPTQHNQTSPCGQVNIEIVVTSGTLKVAALYALTADVEYLLPEQITFVGSGWLPKESSRSGLPGRPTDTAGDYAVARCTGQRLAWVISGNPGSKQVLTWSDREIAAATNYGGNYHVYLVGKHIGPGANHAIKCVEANATGTQANGHALHVGGAIVVNDR